MENQTQENVTQLTDQNEVEEQAPDIRCFSYRFKDYSGVIHASAMAAASMWNKMLDVVLPIQALQDYYYWFDLPAKKYGSVRYSYYLRQLGTFPAGVPDEFFELDLSQEPVEASVYNPSRELTNNCKQLRYEMDEMFARYGKYLKPELIEDNQNGNTRIPLNADFNYFIKYFQEYYLCPAGTRIGTLVAKQLNNAIVSYWKAVKAFAKDKSNPRPEFPHIRKPIRTFELDKKSTSVVVLGNNNYYLKSATTRQYNTLQTMVRFQKLTHDWKKPLLCKVNLKGKGEDNAHFTALVAKLGKQFFFATGNWQYEGTKLLLKTRKGNLQFKSVKYFTIPELHILSRYNRENPVKFECLEDNGNTRYLNCYLLELGIPTYEDFTKGLLQQEAGKAGVPNYRKKDDKTLYDDLVKFKILSPAKLPDYEAKQAFFMGSYFYIPVTFPRNLSPETVFEEQKGTNFLGIKFVQNSDKSWQISIGHATETLEYDAVQDRAMCIDFNSKRVVMCISFNFMPQSFLISSHPLLHIKKKYRSRIGKLQNMQVKEITAILKKQFPTDTNEQLTDKINDMRRHGKILPTKRMHLLWRKQADEIKLEIHKITRCVVNIVLKYGVETVGIAYNKGWKKRQKQKDKRKRDQGKKVMAKKDRIDFQAIAYNTIKNTLMYKLQQYKVKVIEGTEEYTKLASALDHDRLPTLEEAKVTPPIFSGSRFKREKGHTTKRCWYQAKRVNPRTNKPYLIYGDVNDTYNIMRKLLNDETFIEKIIEMGIPNPIYVNYNVPASVNLLPIFTK